MGIRLNWFIDNDDRCRRLDSMSLLISVGTGNPICKPPSSNCWQVRCPRDELETLATA